MQSTYDVPGRGQHVHATTLYEIAVLGYEVLAGHRSRVMNGKFGMWYMCLVTGVHRSLN